MYDAFQSAGSNPGDYYFGVNDENVEGDYRWEGDTGEICAAIEWGD